MTGRAHRITGMSDVKKSRLPAGWGLIAYGLALAVLASVALSISEDSAVLKLVGGLGFVLVLAGVAVVADRRRRT
jgi:protein-S-isoprenylcysteine O-methyltransferase Ste14